MSGWPCATVEFTGSGSLWFLRVSGSVIRWRHTSSEHTHVQTQIMAVRSPFRIALLLLLSSSGPSCWCYQVLQTALWLACECGKASDASDPCRQRIVNGTCLCVISPNSNIVLFIGDKIMLGEKNPVVATLEYFNTKML